MTAPMSPTQQKRKTTFFTFNLMRSQVLYRAAQYQHNMNLLLVQLQDLTWTCAPCMHATCEAWWRYAASCQDRQCLGSRQAVSGIKTGSVWDQDRQRLGSRQAASGIKTGSVWDQDRQCLGSRQAVSGINTGSV